ncbi:PREDICTED: chromosome transmission fidelity protein 8 homolog isoform X2 [Ceratotherium simum simum]|uniref:Chromosome transmission fidelity protein 8 homolog isoform X2 n=1 Tax=Ceratotherium simum simum TaxID=73337 RepID=A0ABM1CWS6_CERSS|nr:PREDICTED: chromosome transmission fidelity protein 8 homolog isoform X2 [Ceratotherium simum simum]
MVQIVISSAGAGGLAEWVLMELQGEIEARYSTGLAGNLLGDLHYTTEEAACGGGREEGLKKMQSNIPATHPDPSAVGKLLGKTWSVASSALKIWPLILTILPRALQHNFLRARVSQGYNFGGACYTTGQKEGELQNQELPHVPLLKAEEVLGARKTEKSQLSCENATLKRAKTKKSVASYF